MKQILWKSDLWLGTVTFGVIALYLFAMAAVHGFVDHASGAAFTCGIAGLIPLILAVVCATNTKASLQRWLKEDRS